jgi:hypothetical protein
MSKRSITSNLELYVYGGAAIFLGLRACRRGRYSDLIFEWESLIDFREKNRSRMPKERPLGFRDTSGFKTEIAKTPPDQFFHILLSPGFGLTSSGRRTG